MPSNKEKLHHLIANKIPKAIWDRHVYDMRIELIKSFSELLLQHKDTLLLYTTRDWNKLVKQSTDKKELFLLILLTHSTELSAEEVIHLGKALQLDDQAQMLIFAETNQPHAFNSVLKKNPSLANNNENIFSSALSLAAENNHVGMMDMILDTCSRNTVKSILQEPTKEEPRIKHFAFSQAAHYGATSCMQWILDLFGKDHIQEIIQENNYHAFINAAIGGSINSLRFLITKCDHTKIFDMLSACDYGPFRFAALYGHTDTVKLLISTCKSIDTESGTMLKAMIEAKDYFAFSQAARYNFIEIMELIIASVPSISVQSILSADNYLSFRNAIETESDEALDYIIKLCDQENMHEMLAADYYQAFNLAARVHNFKAICLLLEICKPCDLRTMLSIQEFDAFKYNKGHTIPETIQAKNAITRIVFSLLTDLHNFETIETIVSNITNDDVVKTSNYIITHGAPADLASYAQLIESSDRKETFTRECIDNIIGVLTQENNLAAFKRESSPIGSGKVSLSLDPMISIFSEELITQLKEGYEEYLHQIDQALKATNILPELADIILNYTAAAPVLTSKSMRAGLFAPTQTPRDRPIIASTVEKPPSRLQRP